MYYRKTIYFMFKYFFEELLINIYLALKILEILKISGKN